MEFETIAAGDIIFGRDSIEKKVENPTEQSDDPSTNIVSVEIEESTNVAKDGSLLTSDETSTSNISKTMEDAVPKSHEIENTKVSLCVSDSSDASKINTNPSSTVIFTEGT